MKNRVRRLVNFRFDRYKEIELRLEDLAAKGLFLEECSPFLWSFRKGEPKNLKYTVTYFSEGSLFNPDLTENQQTYIEYAKAAGWNIVTQLNQMQIFCSEAEHPIPFETDEREKLDNIKTCMKKSFLPSMLVLMLVFLFNLIVHFYSYQENPMDFLSDTSRLLSAVMMFAVILYNSFILVDYVIWCKRSENSIEKGGTCIERTGRIRRIFDGIFLCGIFCVFGLFLLHVASKGQWFGLLIGVAQIPILMGLFWSSIKYLKKKKAAAMVNRVISFAVLIFASFAYLTLIFLLILRFDLDTGREGDYRTVTWELSPTEHHDYRLYRDELPLTCEDLYGQIEYDYYSYERTVDSTIFLTVTSYRQDSLPAKDAPPRLEYQIIEPHFGFAYHRVRKQLLTIPDWRQTILKPVDYEVFGTSEAYQEYYGDNPTGRYLLFFADKIITLNMEDVPTPKQIGMIKERLMKGVNP